MSSSASPDAGRPASTDPFSGLRARFGLESRLVDTAVRERTIARLRQRGIRLPRFAELEDPSQQPAALRSALAGVDPLAPDPRNLHRIHWYNDAGIGRVGAPVPAHLVLPPALTGVAAAIVVVLGDRFPLIGAHKVLAAYACLVPRLVTGQFDPASQRAVWPSTGNYCRGGVAISRLLGCRGVAVLPENMSVERFEWLGRWVEDPLDIVRTPGSESNVKEIYDACAELARDSRNVILNQFCEFGNALAHWRVTGSAFARVFEALADSGSIRTLHAFVSATGSAGTLSAGDRLKALFGARIAAVEPAECPTLLRNGFGEHGIQGIGDKHVPFIHHVHAMDDVLAVSDEATDGLFYLAGDPAGRRFLSKRRGVPAALVQALAHVGPSGWANILAAIHLARAAGLDERAAILTVATDGAALYRSERPRILARRFGGQFDEIAAAETFGRFVLGAPAAEHLELGSVDRERMFNLGYFTWVEQQGVPVEAFVARRRPEFWTGLRSVLGEWEEQIDAFNEEVWSGAS